MLGVMRGAGEDGAVKKAQVRLEGMFDGHGPHDGVLDVAARGNELVVVGFIELQAERSSFDNGVERAAVGDIKFDSSQALDGDGLITLVKKRRHVAEGSSDDLAV